MDFNLFSYPAKGNKLAAVERPLSHKLDAIAGESLIKEKTPLLAYDESINKFGALEGSAFLTSHSLILIQESEYIPSCLLTFYFYTKANRYSRSGIIRADQDPAEIASKKDYVKDRYEFITANAPPNSIVFIDGPLIGGQITSYTERLNDALLRKNIIPLFCVKNSFGSLVTDNMPELIGQYNSDLHWAYEFLKPGERSCFFKYKDPVGHAKLFCYIKPFDVSPERVEMHVKTFEYPGHSPDFVGS